MGFPVNLLVARGTSNRSNWRWFEVCGKSSHRLSLPVRLKCNIPVPLRAQWEETETKEVFIKKKERVMTPPSSLKPHPNLSFQDRQFQRTLCWTQRITSASMRSLPHHNLSFHFEVKSSYKDSAGQTFSSLISYSSRWLLVKSWMVCGFTLFNRFCEVRRPIL